MKVMVFDVGGTEIKYSVMDDTMNYYESGSVPTPSDSQEHFLETMAEIYRPHRDEVDGIALSLPGFIDAEHGVVKGGGAPSIVYNIGTPVGPRLAEKCGCKVWIGFTPDEEVGAGADLFDLAIFQADYAYTVDGDYEGEVAYENFNAASAIFHIKGVNVHPGEAKDIMVNAALVGCEIVSRLPEAETPAHTSGREGFYHLTDMSGDVASATLSFIIRDHDKTTFEKRLQNLRDLAQSMNQKYGPETVTLDIEHSYENMISVIEDKMEIVDLAKQAIASEGLTPLSRPIRGGTDGARLSFMGLPCPNLGTGGYGFHGPYEHISVEGMQTAVRILKNIATHPIRK